MYAIADLPLCARSITRSIIYKSVPPRLQHHWRAELCRMLERWPRSLVGEFGLDRAARVPGTSRKTNFEHQMALVREQMEVAAEYQRPVCT
jgi:Tat protein secretion system quality control protein TatD with DNase activity